jgi:acetoin utilization protein AcuB
LKTAAAMTRDVIVVPMELKLSIAGRIMEEKRIRHLPVISGGRLAGILSNRDVLRFTGSPQELTMTCGEAMTAAPVTCTAATMVSRVAEQMLEHKIDALPVLSESGNLIGLVTTSDLLALLIEHAGLQKLPFDYHLSIAGSDEVAVPA